MGGAGTHEGLHTRLRKRGCGVDFVARGQRGHTLSEFAGQLFPRNGNLCREVYLANQKNPEDIDLGTERRE